MCAGLKKMMAAKVILLACIVSSTVAQVFFKPNVLRPPRPCDNSQGFNYCGDESDYPKEKINDIVDRTIAIQMSPETRRRFFTPGPTHSDSTSGVGDDTTTTTIDPACSSRTELIPRFARAKNVRGKWKYLVQSGEDEVQQFEVTLCQDVGKRCINDEDSPSGPDRTKCVQLFKTQKLLAVDEKGEIEVDTFPLPSACICHFKSQDFGFDLSFGFGVRQAQAPAQGRPQIQARFPSNCTSVKLDNAELKRQHRLNMVKKGDRRNKERANGQDGSDNNEHSDNDNDNSGSSEAGPAPAVATIGNRSGGLKFGPRFLFSEGRRRRRQADGGDDAVIFGGRRSSEPGRPRPDADAVFGDGDGRPARRRSFVPSPCAGTAGVCAGDDAGDDAASSYPEAEVTQAVLKDVALRSPAHFRDLFGPACSAAPSVALKNGLFTHGEQALCASSQEYIYPTVAQNVRGQWKYVVNTNSYKQGVTVQKCLGRVKDKPCTYGGQNGLTPSATVCKQSFSVHTMLAIDYSGEAKSDNFRIPSACLCHLVNKDLFAPKK